MTPPERDAPPAPDTARPNPYVGPRALQHGERIHGRDREINELRGAILSERIVLLYSQSGAGKTSLIEAGLRPEFEQRRFQVMPTIRVGYEAPSETPTENRYRLSVLASLESAKPAGEQVSPEVLASIGLSEYFQSLSQGDPDLNLFLVFDQFEEIFTLDPTDWEVKEAFLQDLGHALSDRSIFVLFSMREDFIAQLDPYQASIPTRFGNRYRLELLGPSEARQAIQRPAEEAGVEFVDEAASELVDDLRRVLVDRGATTSLEPGPSVEPVQLQVVCEQLWEKLDPDAAVIESKNVDDIGNVNEALAGYYAAQVGAVAKDTRVKERKIRDWFVEELISLDGFRTQTRKGPGRKSTNVLSKLEGAHLIRADRRRGTQWYELTHDRFVEPIRASNLDFHRRRRAKLLKILVPVVALTLMALASIVVDLLKERPIIVSESPFTTLTENPAQESALLPASQVQRYRFDDARSGEEVVLLVSAEPVDSSTGVPAEIDVRLSRLGTGEEGDTLEAGATQSIQPNGSTTDAVSQGVALGESPDTSTTMSTTKALQDSVRGVERTYSLPADGSYVIEISVNIESDITLTYQRTAGVAAPEIQVGVQAGGSIDSPGAISRFDLTVAENETMEVVLESLDALDGILVLLDEDGAPLDSVDVTGIGDRESLVRTFEQGGTFTVNVTGLDGSIGAFTLEMDAVQVTPIDAGETVFEATTGGGSTSVYSFSADPGEVIVASLAHGANISPTLEVSGASGRQSGFALVEGDPIEYAGIWEGGNGLIVVRDQTDEQGEFAVDFGRFDAVPVDIDEPIEGQGASGEPLYYSFQGIRGEVYSVDTSMLDNQPAIFAPGDASILGSVFVAPFDGDYLIVVHPDSSDPYTLVLSLPDLEEIAFGEARSGEVFDRSESVAYVFAAEAGASYAVTLESTGQFPPLLLLVTAPDGIPEAFDVGWAVVPDLPAGLTCDELFAEGLSYEEAVLYATVYEIGTEACQRSYPAEDVDRFIEEGVIFELFADGIAPFDGEYLITFVPDDVGSYTIFLDP